MAETTRLWTTYKVGQKSTNPNWCNPDCQPLVEVSHVTHIDNALEILRRQEITAQPVYDESVLRKSNMAVVWLSPNKWEHAGGSRYGNVEFVLHWSTLIRDKYAYRIEVKECSPKAFRILLSGTDLGNMYPRYDPAYHDGPWRRERTENTHHWNGQICLELMLDESISLDQVLRVDFCTHHPKRCCISAGSCLDAGKQRSEGGALFLAGAVSRGLRIADLGLSQTEDDGRNVPAPTVISAWIQLRSLLYDDELEFTGSVAAGSPLSEPLMRAVLGSVCARSTDWRRIVAFFESRTAAIESLACTLEHHLELSPASIIR